MSIIRPTSFDEITYPINERPAKGELQVAPGVLASHADERLLGVHQLYYLRIMALVDCRYRVVHANDAGVGRRFY